MCTWKFVHFDGSNQFFFFENLARGVIYHLMSAKQAIVIKGTFGDMIFLFTKLKVY